MEKHGIYIHTPFCVHKCNYCDFNSYAGYEDKAADYFAALLCEINSAAEKYKISADTVYFGGGTPSCVNPEFIVSVLNRLKNRFDIQANSEITIECNPATIDLGGLKKLRRAGINRISIGLQSIFNETLSFLGRIHTFEDFLRCYSDAREAGFENISLDLMFALPNQTLSGWEETVRRAAEIGAEHISAYCLKVEEGTPFASMPLSLPDDGVQADMYNSLVDILKGCGYERYEISNFAKTGAESRHNLKYWSGCGYLGLGSGAHSYIGNRRFSNVCGIDEYIKRIESGALPVCEEVRLSREDMMSEFIFLGLRRSQGINTVEFKNRFGEDIFDLFKEPLGKYIKLGFLVHSGDRIYFADKAFFVSNTILADFV